MKRILVAGSNKDGNDIAKENAIALFEKAGHQVYHSSDLFRSEADLNKGNDLVLQKLAESNILYVVCSVNGYTGTVTAARLGYAKAKPWIEVFSSHQLIDSDLDYYVQTVISPEELIEYLRLEL